MRILFTSVGRRVELVQAYRSAAEKCGERLEIYGGDSSNTAPALQFCDKTVQLPLIRENAYIPFLVRYCEDEKIDALIPTIDTDLMLLAESRGQFQQTRVVISDPEKIKLCRDKRLTGKYFLSLGLSSPTPTDDAKEYKSGFPAFIKPKDGSSSIHAYRADNAEELLALTEMVPDYIIQPFVSGTEYTIDAFCDFEGNQILITPRIRLAVRAGEVLKTRIVQDQTILDEMMRLIADFKPCRPITVQMIRDESGRRDTFIEINPRYGGGAPLSMKAGADSAEMMIRLLRGERLSYQERAAEDGATYSRFDQSVRVDR